jgi:hypothetical protein
MSMRDEPLPPEPPGRPPGGQLTRDLVLAQALDACLRAERARPGAADEVIARAPVATRAELRRLVNLARALRERAPEGVPSPIFRAAARQRLMQRIGGESPPAVVPLPSAGPGGPAQARPAFLRRRWVWRIAAGLLAATVAVVATLTTSASALPGDPLYGLKTAREELDLRLATDDQAEVLSMLQRADARLDETSRLLARGRMTEALQTTQ